MEVPLSVTTLDLDQLALVSAGAADVKAVSARVPSLLLESSFGRAFPRFYIRGLGNTDFDLNASQPVSMIVDEVVLENPIVKGMPLFDVRRTEVLRGPQGTLFGRNTPAGIVKFDTVKPSKDTDGFARVSYGTYNNVDFKGAVGGALSDTAIGARLAALPVAVRLDRQHLHEAGRRARRPEDLRRPRAAPLGAHGEVPRPRQRPRLGPRRHGAHLPRQHHQEGDRRAGGRLRAGQGGPGRPEPAEDPGVRRGAQARLRVRQGHADLGDRLRDARQDVQPRRHRRRLRRGLRAPLRPRPHPLPLGERRRAAQAEPVHPGAAPGQPHEGPLGLAPGLLLLRREPQGGDLQLRLPHARQPAGRVRLPDPGRHLLGGVRLDRLPADRPLGPEGRPPLHDGPEGLRGREARPDLPAAHRAPDRRCRPTPTSSRGTSRPPTRRARERQPVQPRRHRLPRALDPGAHPLLRRLRGRRRTRPRTASPWPTRRRSPRSRSG